MNRTARYATVSRTETNPPISEETSARARAWVWPVALAAAIFYASSQSRVASPDVSNIDKIAHFIVYGWLGLLLARWPAVARLRPLSVWSAVVVTSLYGVSDELHQHFTPGRSMELADWIADTAGAAVAVAMYARLTVLRRWLERPFGARVEIPAASRSTGAT